MASTKVRGITIELGADTSGISQALKGVNSQIGSTTKQLKDVERLLKLDPKNTELLAQKQRLLTERVTETKEKLETLKKAQEEVNKRIQETGEGQKEYDALTREIAQCETELKQAEKQASGFNATASKISATADKMADGFSKAAQKTRALSMAAGGLIVAAGGMAYKAAQDADELNTLAKQSGFTTAELQKMKYAAERIDVPMETIVSSARKMEKQLGSSEEKFTDLGIAVRNADGTYRSVNDIFFDTVKALSEVSDETERDILAQDLFGKSANDLAGIIDDGAESLRLYGEEAENMNLIIPQDQLDKANELNDAIDKIKSESQGAFASIGVEIAEMLLPYLPQVTAKIEEILAYIKQIDPETLKLAAGIVGVIAVLSPLMSALSGVCSGISAVGSSISWLIANPLVALAVAVVAFVALCAIKGDEMIAILDRVDSSLTDVFEKDWTESHKRMGDVLNGFFENYQNLWDGVTTRLQGVIDFIRGVFTGDWGRAWKGLTEIFKGELGQWAAIAKFAFNNIISLANTMISGLNALLNKINSLSISSPFGGSTWSPNLPTIGKIPYMANGGILSDGSAIVGEAGPELLTMANGRAIVQPLTNNTNNYAGNTNNFYIQSSDPYAVAEEVSRIIDQDYAKARSVYA
jgi:phage-related minor tail protein